MSLSTPGKETFLQYLLSSGSIRAPEAPLLGRDAVDGYPEDLAAMAVNKGVLTERGAVKALAGFYGRPYIDLDTTLVAQSALNKLSPETARELGILPFLLNEDELSVAMPCVDLEIMDRIRNETGCDLLVHLSERTQILSALEIHYCTAGLPGGKEMAELGTHLAADGDVSMVKEVSLSLIMNALRLRASDIHIEPQENGLRVRMRIDGVLHEQVRCPLALSVPLTARYKIMAELDVAETRRPQDGRFTIKTESRSVDLRISFAPSVHGEKVVIRLLERSGAAADLLSMEFSETIGNDLEEVITAPNGIILVTGPTGSGKSTTCYAVLEYLNTIDRNIVTIEDPVEYCLDGLTQSQVQHNIGLDFSLILRSVLRQDPDVILIGEIRDLETARVAVQAALTGHLVISTLHTNNAIQAVMRLVEMGVDPFMVAPSLLAVLGQRLARRVCGRCRIDYEPTVTDRKLFEPYGAEPEVLYRGEGCVDCSGTGYRGRLGLHELVVLNETIRELVARGASCGALRSAAELTGYHPMQYDGLKKAWLGLTTASEISRVAPRG